MASVLRYSRPPAGKIAPVPVPGEGPYSPQPSPYTPGFEQKVPPMSTSPGMNGHESWMSGPTAASTVRSMSPDAEHQQGYMSPNQFGPGYIPPQGYSPQGGYAPVTQQQSPNFHLQSSPSETPWSPGGFGIGGNPQYSQIPQSQEMGTGAERAPVERPGPHGPQPLGYVHEMP
jgi:hypothetical protein